MSELPKDVAGALQEVRARMDRSAHDADRASGAVQLVCVSKGKQASDILPALEAGSGFLVKTAFRNPRKNGRSCASASLIWSCI